MIDFLKSEHAYYNGLIFSIRNGDNERQDIELNNNSDPVLAELLEKVKAKNARKQPEVETEKEEEQNTQKKKK